MSQDDEVTEYPLKTSATHKPELRSLGDIGLSNFLPYLTNRLASTWNHGLQENLRKNGLNTVRMRVLAVLSINDGISVKELCHYTVIEQSTLSRALDTLEDLGMIVRTAPLGDKRVRAINITVAGRAAFTEVWPGMFGLHQLMLEGISDEDRQALNTTLHRILKNLEAHDYLPPR